MRKILLFTILFAFNSVSNAQENTVQRQNDVMISPLDVLFASLNVSYERLLNEDMGVGANFIYASENSWLATDLNSAVQFAPYFRYYAGKKYASGFFAEAFIPITHTNRNLDYYNYYNENGFYNYSSVTKEIKETSLGFGFGLGGKWITKRNILFEASIGVARLFGENYSDFTSRGMLGIGYRF